MMKVWSNQSLETILRGIESGQQIAKAVGSQTQVIVEAPRIQEELTQRGGGKETQGEVVMFLCNPTNGPPCRKRSVLMGKPS